MDCTVTKEQLNEFLTVVLPDLRDKLADDTVELEIKQQLFEAYLEVLRFCAVNDFASFNEYLEIDEDKTNENRGFFYHRKESISEISNALNDMEIHDAYDTLLISCPPRTGKTTTGIRFLAWIIGRHPENTQLAISYSDSITTSFYIGVMEVVQNPRFMDVFPDSKLVNQNAKREEIWLKVFRRYPSISFVPINGSMTGRAEAGNYLYCDDLVSGIEEAMSPTRMDKLWQTYSVNARQRKKSGCKEIHIATRWSVNDPMSRLEVANEGNPRFKSIRIPCVNEEGESNFDFVGGFTKEYYEDQRNSMDEISFGALYMQDPVEREGLLYHKDELQFYFELPNEKPDAIIAVCDSKNLGSDNVASPIGYVYGDFVYVEDVVYNNGLPEVTRPLVVNKWIEHKVTRGDVEMNNGGNYYAEELDKQLRERGAHTSVRMFFSSNNKMTKIVTYSDFIKKHFIFKASSTYSKRSEYAKFMSDVYKFTQTGNNKHDDCVDSLAMLAQLYQDLSGLSIKILKRKELGI